MISKVHNFKDIGFEAYSKLYNLCVVPVIDYCSGVWGFWNFPRSDMVQNRAIRFYFYPYPRIERCHGIDYLITQTLVKYYPSLEPLSRYG